MVKVTVFYPVKEGDFFDMEYYSTQHVALSSSVFGDALKGLGIEQVSNNSPECLYQVIGNLFFETEQDFYDRYLPNAEILAQDAIQYTNVTPILQISNLVLWTYQTKILNGQIVENACL